MADVTYQCQVNKAHTKKVPDYTKAAPFCCGKPMIKSQAAAATTSTSGTAQPAASKPVAQPTTAKPAQQAPAATQKPPTTGAQSQTK